MLKLLLLMLIFTMPSYSQSDLSPAAKLLIQQARDESSSTPPQPSSLAFNFGVNTRFDGGVTFPIDGFETCFSLFNVTSLEFYIPTFSRKSQFLATFRFSTPVIEDYYNDLDGLYKMRLGFGLGFVGTMFDKRNSLGKGLLITGNTLFAMDMIFLNDDLDRYEAYTLLGSYAVYRAEFGVRFNQFVHKNLAFVFGVDIGAGVVSGYLSKQISDDGYPIEPLTGYGEYTRGIYTFGITAGLMF